MINKTEYAVFRFLDRNGYCHMVSDYVQGESLAQYASRGISVSRQRFWEWVCALLFQAEQFYKWEDGESYGWFMPYSVVLSGSGEILLMDVQEESSRDIRSIMEKKSVRALFVRKERVLSQRMTAEDDAYGLGKTLQFMAAKLSVEPAFTGRETRILERMIAKCVQGQELTAGLLKELRREAGKGRQAPGPGKKRKVLLAVLAVAVSLLTALTVLGAPETGETGAGAGKAEIRQEETGEETPREETDMDGGTREEAGETASLYLETALLYLYGLESEEPGMEYLERSGEEGSALADCYRRMYQYFQRPETRFREEELAGLLVEGEQLLGREALEESQVYLYRLPFLRGWSLLDTEEAGEHVLALGEELEGEGQGLSWSQEEEVRSLLAEAREKTGDLQGALEEYEYLKEETQEEEKLEQIYLKLTELYGEEDREALWDTCREAVEALPESEALWLQYVRLQCGDKTVDRETCVETVKKALEAAPELKDDSEFQKLCQTGGISVEGENVWAEEKN